MIDSIINDAKQHMDKSIESLKMALTKLRTGRAHPSLLEHIKVNYYDVATPLNQVANVTIENARTLTITPWEKNMVAEVEKAILNANLGLNPNSAGVVIRVPLPPLTEERRKSLAKLVREEAEGARVAIRNIRREANHDFKELLKGKEMSEDDERRAQTRVQELTDRYVKQVDAVAAEKEKELMQI